MNSIPSEAPDPEFRAHLEWEVVRALRRESSLGTRRVQRRRRRVRAAAIVCACLALGVVSNIASAQVRDGTRRDSLLEAARADLNLLMLRRQLLQAQADHAEQQRRVGVISRAAADAAAAQLDELRNRIARIEIDMQEVQAAAQPPRNDLVAPLVGGRDYVKERIQLDLADAQRRVAMAEAQRAEIDRQLRVGVATQLTGLEAEVDLARARAAMALDAQRLALRQEHVDKGTPAEQLALRLDAAQRQQDLETTGRVVELMRARVDALRRQQAAGTASDIDLMRAELDLKERMLELVTLKNQLVQRAGAAARDTIH